jgi:hypothetical protein
MPACTVVGGIKNAAALGSGKNTLTFNCKTMDGTAIRAVGLYPFYSE